jgi:hypothetical protein
MLAKLKQTPLKVLIALAILLAMLVALVVTIPIAGAVMVFSLVLWWSINTLLEHYIQ